MSKGTKQKYKLWYLIKIMEELTDDEHSLTMSEILTELEKYGITAERKSIYDDFEAMRDLGFDVVGDDSGRYYSYFLGSRDFELPELKLLVDVIGSSKFITEKKSKTLIKKLESFTSVYNAKKLDRQVTVSNRVKTMNESIYFNVDIIHTAIAENCQVRFKYFSINAKKEIEYRRDGEFYYVSPWALLWNEENYYLVAYDEEDEKIKHFRVDKMNKMCLVDAEREGAKVFSKFNVAEYAKKTFGMYSGEMVNVKMEFDNDIAGVVIDRFGKDVRIIKNDKKKFVVSEEVQVSLLFYAWMFGLGDKAKILGPQSVIDGMKEACAKQAEMYK
ncbi:MAG: WYL domain-containing protein [Lachnospiraceae bacterium]|nr:WYL domain-containing protein [Lachnospiraceae bacterium]